jgi:hypothetical protein
VASKQSEGVLPHWLLLLLLNVLFLKPSQVEQVKQFETTQVEHWMPPTGKSVAGGYPMHPAMLVKK